jgi:hypothetical protein
MSKVHRFERAALAAAALAAGLVLAGCGTPGVPMPPSLKLPDTVADLAAVRTGNQVTLTWTMPKKNTDKLLLKGNVTVRVCRKDATGSCTAAGAELQLAPGSDASFAEALPAPLAAGSPRPLSYFVELKNRNGRSAGLSNAAVVLAGEAPMPVSGLAAEVRKQGVALRWTALDATAQKSAPAAIRLRRKLLTPQLEKPKQGLMTPTPEPLEQNLLIEAGAHPGRALDRDIRFGQTYEYRAQRVARVTVDGRTLELAGELSAPVRVEALDVFPPAVPTGLAAVATAGETGSEAAIDLSWQPGAEADLAGYAVYRREGDGPWQRISPAQPLVPPAFHDAHVLAGHTYRYAVTAIDQGSHESVRSAETEETVPNP